MLPTDPDTHPDFKLPIQPPKSSRKGMYITIVVALVIFLTAAGAFYYIFMQNSKQGSVQPITSSTPSAKKSGMLELDTTKIYGNKYAKGLLPVGDGKYVSDGAKKGTVYACSQYAQNLQAGSGGADTRGPWFTNNNTQYDINKKIHVRGSVSWTGTFSNSVSGNIRTISTNDLPLGHTTGVFPISSSDPAYSYDRNPNTIKAQTLTYSLNANPTYGDAQCMGGEVGVMLTGVAIFNAFDAGGRDAGAWEVQDDCNGHPQVSGEYHYHTLSSCIKDVSASTVIGYALDGFPITGPQVSSGNVLTTDDLDECHGIASDITVDGKTVHSYHYVMTQDFPYSASCFRSKASNPPGQQEHPGGQQQGPPPQGGQAQGGQAPPPRPY